ncbi:MAG: hypothetical protein WKF59_03200 [Chitinophagaceae bacterium]
MKLSLKLALLLTSMSLAFCTKTNIQPEQDQQLSLAPQGIQAKIADVKTQLKSNQSATLYKYNYKGQVVYLITSDCCDQYNYLYDENSNIICAPSGGITGLGDGRCTDFSTEKKDPVLLWKMTK